jgi:hypothetical protein
MKKRLGRIEQKFDGVDLKALVRKVDGLDSTVSGLDRKVADLVKAFPRMMGEVMREVLQERDPKKG